MDANSYVQLKANPHIPDFRPGDAVRVHARVVEGDRQRIQVFEGVVIRIRRGGVNSTFTVRRVSHGVGIERVFPYFSPLVEKVEVSKVGRVRRAKLYYLRQRVGKAARIKVGSRSRYEELTAVRPVIEEEYVEEEEAAATEADDAAEAATERAVADGEAADAEHGDVMAAAEPAEVEDEVPAVIEAEPEAEAIEAEESEGEPGTASEDAGDPPAEEAKSTD